MEDGAENRDSECETRYVLQNRSLMEQIERSLKTHREGTGYRPSPEEMEAFDLPPLLSPEGA